MDEGTAKLFAKYWGDSNLAHNEEFWGDVYEYYSHEYCNAPLPLEYNPPTVRLVLEMLDCPPGQCGKCCRYERIKIKPHDIQRIMDNSSHTLESLGKLIKTEDGKMFLSGVPDGCPFLEDNSCTIHKFRPDVCYMFPISTRDAVVKGEKVQQMQIRVKCEPVMAVVRKVITQTIDKGDKMLLPDLTIIPKV